MAVTIQPGQNLTVPTGGTAVQVVPANPNGGVITNPYAAAEPLFVNPIGAATLSASNITFALQPGQSWTVVPGQTSPTTVNAATNGHPFSAIYW